MRPLLARRSLEELRSLRSRLLSWALSPWRRREPRLPLRRLPRWEEERLLRLLFLRGEEEREEEREEAEEEEREEERLLERLELEWEELLRPLLGETVAARFPPRPTPLTSLASCSLLDLPLPSPGSASPPLPPCFCRLSPWPSTSPALSLLPLSNPFSVREGRNNSNTGHLS